MMVRVVHSGDKSCGMQQETWTSDKSFCSTNTAPVPSWSRLVLFTCASAGLQLAFPDLERCWRRPHPATIQGSLPACDADFAPKIKGPARGYTDPSAPGSALSTAAVARFGSTIRPDCRDVQLVLKVPAQSTPSKANIWPSGRCCRLTVPSLAPPPRRWV